MSESKVLAISVSTVAAVAIAVAGAVMASGCYTTCSKVPVANVPEAAQKAIDQYAEGGLIQETEMKKKCGKVLFEANVKKSDGTKLEIVVNADGKLYKLERKDPKSE